MKTIYKLIVLVLISFFMAFNTYGKQSDLAAKKPSKIKTTRKYDASLMISPTTVMQKIRQKERLFLVDIRHEKEFNTFKIPGSINIPLSFIKTKSFLKSNPIILVHKSIAYSELSGQVKDLQKKGFNIKIMQGGLWAWKHKGGKLVGNHFSYQDLNQISAKTFFMEKNHEEWVILNACSKPSPAQKQMAPKALYVQAFGKLPDMVRSVFSKRNSPLQTIVIFNETGNYTQFEEKISNAYGNRVFYLKGGIKAYREFLNYQALANKPKQERIQKAGHCEPCNKSKTEKPNPKAVNKPMVINKNDKKSQANSEQLINKGDI